MVLEQREETTYVHFVRTDNQCHIINRTFCLVCYARYLYISTTCKSKSMMNPVRSLCSSVSPSHSVCSYSLAVGDMQRPGSIRHPREEQHTHRDSTYVFACLYVRHRQEAAEMGPTR